MFGLFEVTGEGGAKYTLNNASLRHFHIGLTFQTLDVGNQRNSIQFSLFCTAQNHKFASDDNDANT